MDSTRLFTCIQEGVLADALYEDGKLMELSLHPLEHASILGNIYIGKVRNIVKNIQAAFVEIENGMLCYLPLEDAQAPVYTKPKKEGQPLVQGDELLVQVSREAVKTKQPSVTTKISMNGKYLVFTIGNGKLGCSGKLSGAEKTRLRQWGQEQKLPEDLGMIIRTNASGVAEEDHFQISNILPNHLILIHTFSINPKGRTPLRRISMPFSPRPVTKTIFPPGSVW